MTADDKCGIGSGLTALGLAAGAILLAQLLHNGLIVLPHRELVVPEAIFDAVVCVACLPAGIYLLYKGIRSDNGADEK